MVLVFYNSVVEKTNWWVTVVFERCFSFSVIPTRSVIKFCEIFSVSLEKAKYILLIPYKISVYTEAVS